ncbi:MAG: hypothetical protein LBQ27_03795 [Clostridiales bacterium]|jgi:hypothetical protein|nr:hypothetical protein [Clostridiales bacterium]
MANNEEILIRKNYNYSSADGTDMPVVFVDGDGLNISKALAAPQNTVVEPKKSKVKSYGAVFKTPFIATPKEIEKMNKTNKKK